MKALFFAQTALPLALVALMFVRPLRSAVGTVAQVAGSILLLAGSVHVGLWLFPPWWTPHAATVALIGMAAWRVKRDGFASRGPLRWEWAGVALFAVAGVVGAGAAIRAASAAHAPPETPPVRLGLPLGPGRYVVVNGGTWELMNAHRQSMRREAVRLQPWRGNGHAVDIVGVNVWGARAPGVLPRSPESYEIFGVPVIAPCSGQVLLAVDGLPDMSVPDWDRSNPAGNHVILECDGIHVVLAHLKRGSVRVAASHSLAAGDTLGAVGNSGGTHEPHLHIHAQRPGPPGQPMAADPLPSTFNGRVLVRGDRIVVPRPQR